MRLSRKKRKYLKAKELGLLLNRKQVHPASPKLQAKRNSHSIGFFKQSRSG